MKTYDDIAEWYDQWIGSHSLSEDPFFLAVDKIIGEIEGKRICDLACGQGRVARYLAARGANFVGIDQSAKLLAIARRQEEMGPLGIEYVQADAGLQLEHLREVGATSTTSDSQSLSHLSRPIWQEVPTVLVVSCRKPDIG